MLRLALLGTALALCAVTAHAADPADGSVGPRRRAMLPPDIAYRDPFYPVPPLRISMPPQSSNVPLYNVPPPHFPRF